MNKTYRQMFMCKDKAMLHGHAWNVELSVTGEAILWREVRVKVRDRRTGMVWCGRDGKGAGFRVIQVRRPADDIGKVA